MMVERERERENRCHQNDKQQQSQSHLTYAIHSNQHVKPITFIHFPPL